MTLIGLIFTDKPSKKKQINHGDTESRRRANQKGGGTTTKPKTFDTEDRRTQRIGGKLRNFNTEEPEKKKPEGAESSH